MITTTSCRIIDQITAQQIAGSAMFGTIESMRNNDLSNVRRGRREVGLILTTFIIIENNKMLPF